MKKIIQSLEVKLELFNRREKIRSLCEPFQTEDDYFAVNYSRIRLHVQELICEKLFGTNGIVDSHIMSIVNQY